MPRLFRTFGVLRLAHLGLAFLLALAALYPQNESIYSGWGILPTMVAPALAPLYVFTLPLDSTMAMIFAASCNDQADKDRFRIIIRTNLATLVILLLAWSHFFYTHWWSLL